MPALLQELRFAVRVLRNAPLFSTVAIATLGVGMAASTTVFSWIDTLLLRPVPGVVNAQELGVIEAVTPEGGYSSSAHPDFRDFQREMKTVSGVFSTQTAFFTVGPSDQSLRTIGQLVSANFFAVLGVKPFLGRLLLPQEDRDDPGAFPVAVISHRLWRSHFQSAPTVVGRLIRINGRQLTVVGVAPPDFVGTVPGASLDIWVPFSMNVQMGALNTWAANDRNAKFMNVAVRLKHDASFEQATAEAKAVAARIASAYPATHRGYSAIVLPVNRTSTGFQSTLRTPLQLLSIICVLVLLISCVNVANLLMARSVARQREFGVRVALGAGRWHLIRQLLIEVSLLSGAAAVLGVIMAQWMGEALVYVFPPLDASVRSAVEPLFHAGFNVNSFAFAALCVSCATLLSTLMPALALGRVDVNESLKEGGRSKSAAGHSHQTRAALVVLEVALASVALIGAGLAVRSFQDLAARHPGFDSTNVLVAHFHLSTNGYSLKAERQFNRDLRLRLENAPGIDRVSYAESAPLSLFSPGGERVRAEGSLVRQDTVLSMSRAIVAPGYFDLMRIPLVAGRDFTARDDRKSPLVIIVNETFARRYYGDKGALGRKVNVSGEDFTIVGVARDSKYRNLPEGPTSFFYGSFDQIFYSGHTNLFYIRTNGDTSRALASLRRAVSGMDSYGGLFDVLPLADLTQFSLLAERVIASLLSALGVISLILAAVGLYSVMAYTVTERTHDIGVHMAMGARPGQVLALVLKRGIFGTAIGIATGIAIAFAGFRALSSGLNLPVHTSEPPVYAAVALFLLLVSFIASYLPARRASRVDPVHALRAE